jgi:hypothetical protein
VRLCIAGRGNGTTTTTLVTEVMRKAIDSESAHVLTRISYIDKCYWA